MELPTQLPHHYADLETANALRPPVGGAGLIIGVDQHGAPVTVRVFDQEPRSYVVVGGLRLLQMLVVRMLALNGRVLVHTERPGAWGWVTRMASGASGSIAFGAADATVARGTVHRPSVLVIDGDSGVQNATPAGTAWSATLSGYDSLSQWNINALDAADAVFVQQLNPAETQLVERRLSLQGLAQRLDENAPGMIGVLSRGSISTARVHLSGFERWVLKSVDR